MNGFFAGFALTLLLWFLAFLYLRAFIRRRTGPEHILGLLEEEVRQLEADIDEKTEQDLLLLEEKILALREICSEAERRIAVYNREFEKQDNEKQALAVLNKKPLVERLEVKPVKSRRSASPYTAKTAEEAYRTQARKPEPNPSEEVPAASVQPPVPAVPQQQTPQPLPLNITFSHDKLPIKPRPIRERIAELQKAGFSPLLIAKRLKLNPGEVQLFFNLENNTHGNTNA